MKQLNILGNLLSPFNGIAIMGIVAIWATTQFKNCDFKFYLLSFAVFCAVTACIGDICHHKYRLKYEKEKDVAVKMTKEE